MNGLIIVGVIFCLIVGYLIYEIKHAHYVPDDFDNDKDFDEI